MSNGDKDFVAGTVLTAADVDDYLMLQALQKHTNAAGRDAALTARKREGMVTIQDDTNSMTVYSGTAWSTIGPVHGALTAWTPVITQSVNVTFTNTYSRYIRIGRLITGWFSLTVTGAGSVGNAISITGLPFTAAQGGLVVGSGDLFDASVGFKYPGYTELDSTTQLSLRSPQVTPTDNRLGIVTFTAGLAAGDIVNGCIAYEAAADN